MSDLAPQLTVSGLIKASDQVDKAHVALADVAKTLAAIPLAAPAGAPPSPAGPSLK